MNSNTHTNILYTLGSILSTLRLTMHTVCSNLSEFGFFPSLHFASYTFLNCINSTPLCGSWFKHTDAQLFPCWHKPQPPAEGWMSNSSQCQKGVKYGHTLIFQLTNCTQSVWFLIWQQELCLRMIVRPVWDPGNLAENTQLLLLKREDMAIYCETQPPTVHWLSSSISPCSVVRPSRIGDISTYLHYTRF